MNLPKLDASNLAPKLSSPVSVSLSLPVNLNYKKIKIRFQGC
jgi:hypothetical protein